MEKTKHTPGPWRIDKMYTRTRVLARNRVKPTPENPAFVVAQCSTFCGQGTGIPGREEQEANARLIAAAPELLEALRVLESKIQHREGDCYSDDYQGACVCGKEMAQAAIAKAEGRK